MQFQQEPAIKLYYGDGPVPPDRARRATTYEALRAGIAIGLHSPDRKRIAAQTRSRARGFRRLTNEQLEDLCATIGVSIIRPDGFFKTRMEVINELIPILQMMAAL